MTSSPSAGPVCVLVGAPGSGKSSVGARLASRLGVAFRDTDTDIEQASGMPIADIFVTQGEPVFRDLERNAVARAVAEHDGVLSLGGGAVVDPGTRDLLGGQVVVHLDVSLSVALRRTGMNRSRPLLLENPRSTLKRLLDERRGLYAEIADLVLDTDEASPETLATAIQEWLEARPAQVVEQ